ncbi:MAG: hypothetical protein LBG11_11515, partial [Bifidobacteriaceae bacterium]|nr:hypothetical protein [Bifidobacteriaceae bacterium]
MNTVRSLILDANILVRGVPGRRVRELVGRYAQNVGLFVPDVAYAEARIHVPELVAKRGNSADEALATLEDLVDGIAVLADEEYRQFEHQALARIGQRDPRDWPVLAAALALGSPIWTEDQYFFGPRRLLERHDLVIH